MVDLNKIFSDVVEKSEKRDAWDGWNDDTAQIAASTESTFANKSDVGASAEQTAEEPPSAEDTPDGEQEQPRDQEVGALADGHVLDEGVNPLTMTPFGAVVLPEDATPGSLVDDWYKSHEFMGPIRPEYQEGVAGPTPIPRRVT